MKHKKYKSIADITSFSMLLIFFLCSVVSVFSALLFMSLSKDAEIINLSGSLRMQSYRLAFEIAENESENKLRYIDRYDSVLYSTALKSVTNWHSTGDIKNDYFQIVRQWESIKEKLISNNDKEVLVIVPVFVDLIDNFVNEIQIHSENKLGYLISVSVISATMIGLIVAYFIYYINRKVVTPIIHLSEASQSIRQGNFDIDINNVTNNEIGTLSTTFYRMAVKIRNVYQGLEKSLTEQNLQLRSTEQELNLVAKTSSILLEFSPVKSSLKKVITLLCQAESVDAVRLEWEGECIEAGIFSDTTTLSIPLTFINSSIGTLSYQGDSNSIMMKRVAPLISKFIHHSDK